MTSQPRSHSLYPQTNEILDYQDISSDEEDIELIMGFDPDKAKTELLNYRQTTRIALSLDQQKGLGLEIGPNISAEQPWKQLRKELLQDYLPDTPELSELKETLRIMEDEQFVLIGYAPSLSEETEDMFIIFNNERVAKEASEIIQKLEAFERQRAKNVIFKTPGTWQSLGSEREVDMFIVKPKTNLVDVEIQSIYPIKHSKTAEFSFRKADDVRDGYVELLPDRTVFDNISRKQIDAAVQSVPPRVGMEQQTEPTFPTNAWSQYLYEISEEDSEKKQKESVDEGVEELAPDHTAQIVSSDEAVTASNQVEELLKTLEFNQVDMYRNDYPFICSENISKPKHHHFEELFCFVDIEKCAKRYVSSIDWHPQYSGIFVVAYAFRTINTMKNDKDPIVDEVNRAVYEENPVLVWSFDDMLNPKLELISPREITSITFCPYDGNVIIGGTINGQIIIWDIKDRLHKVEHTEVLSPERIIIRQEIHSLMDWTKQNDTNRYVKPTAVSSLENSQRDVISSIKWLAQNVACDANGKIETQGEFTNRIFITSSFDGTICFWNLNWIPSGGHAAKKANKFVEKMPQELQESESVYSPLNKVFYPTFRLVINMPISCLIIDEGEFIRQPISMPRKLTMKTRLQYNIEPCEGATFENRVKCGTFYCDLISATWEGYDFDQGALINEEPAKVEKFAHIHDSVIVGVERSPFIKELDITIGGTVIALWHREWTSGPLIWRERPSRLTAVKWSLNRAAVFYLTREDGIVEAWDLLAKCDKPTMEKSLGGNVLTAISQHIFDLPNSCLAIADYNSNVRIFLIPPYFAEPLENEEERMKQFANKEVHRKKSLEEWKINWRDRNKDLLAAKKMEQEEAQAALAKRQKDERDKRIIEERLAGEKATRQAARDAKKIVYNLPQKLDRKWNEMNYERLLKMLMGRKFINPEELERQIKPIVDKELYEASKQQAFEENFAAVAEELAMIRSKLLPTEKDTSTRELLVKEMLGDFLAHSPKYADTEKELDDIIQNTPLPHKLTFSEILTRGKQRREIISKSLGARTSHLQPYGKKKSSEETQQKRDSSSMIKGRESSELKRRSVTFSMDIKSEKTDSTDHRIGNAAT